MHVGILYHRPLAFRVTVSRKVDSAKLRPTGLSAAENVRGIRFEPLVSHQVLAPSSCTDYQALFETARIQLMDCW